MRVLQIHSGRGVNGAAMHCLLLSRELVRRGHEVAVVCRPDSWMARSLTREPVTVVPSEMNRWPLAELRRISALVRTRHIDVVHTHQSRAHAFGVLLRRFLAGPPTIATAHNRFWQLHWRWNDFVIAPATATAEFHRRFSRVSPQRLAVIHNFIDLAAVVVPAPAVRTQRRRELGADDRSVLIGIVGTVIPRKGLDVLVKALPALLAGAPQARVLVVGREQASYANTVRRLAARLGVAARISWLGERTDMTSVLSVLDVLALPSREEQMPLVILEAMAAGLPVVATSVGGIPECIDDGVTGRLVPPNDPAALAEALQQLAGSSEVRARCGAAGRQRAEAMFSPASQVEKIEAIYRRVLRPSSA